MTIPPPSFWPGWWKGSRGRGLPELLDERLFEPMGVDHAEWDRVASGAAFGFHGLHLTTEAVAAFGELLLREGMRGNRRLVPCAWVELATRRHTDTLRLKTDREMPTTFAATVTSSGCRVTVTTVTARSAGNAWSRRDRRPYTGTGSARRDRGVSAARRGGRGKHPGRRDPRRSAATAVMGTGAGVGGPERSVRARLDASAEGSALPDGATVIVDPVDDGWLLRLGPHLDIEVGHGEWREGSPLGRAVVAAGAWQGDTLCRVGDAPSSALLLDEPAAPPVGRRGTARVHSPP
ncbi:hypothetical protein GCM10010345_61370 [Streptomyces canarius]|uniref:Dehydrogenase (DH) domain-containing protein n=1 Tax=Streptomyces canarius TaxID=285453 RepID=A0ABQ3CZD6_9ACTN|nr:hypothetical protein GCM10010345_61370 [Streptomyces canarius]